VTIKAIGFDVGDTLLFYADTPLDWSSRYGEALAAVSGACGVSPTPNQFADAREILLHYNTRVRARSEEIRAEEIFALILRAWSLDSTDRLPAAIDAFFTFFQQRMRAFPETLGVLHALREGGMRLGALTDVPYGMPATYVQRDLDRAGISPFLHAVVTSAMVGVRKPEVKGYHALAASLTVTLNEMLYVGNEPKDVIGAQRAGVQSAFLDRTRAGGNHGQTFTITSMSAIQDIILSIDPNTKG
jgi:putative hydrolase of the HAD superfamily